MNTPKQFKYLAYKSLTLSTKKDYQLLQKRHYKVKALYIPLKGSNNLSEYAITKLLKNNKPSLRVFKTLSIIRIPFISQEFLKYFLKNKQILRNVKAFIGGMANLSYERFTNLSLVINNMKNLTKIDDLTRFSPQNGLLPRVQNFTFPKRSLRQGNDRLVSLKCEGQKIFFKRTYPLRKVRQTSFSPNFNFKRMFSYVEILEFDASFLNKLNELLNNRRIKRVIIIDKNSSEIDETTLEEALKTLDRLKPLYGLEFNLETSQNIEPLPVV